MEQEARRRTEAMLDFVPPLPPDFPRPPHGVGGLPLRELFRRAAEEDLASLHLGGGEALHLVDYASVMPHAGKACKSKRDEERRLPQKQRSAIPTTTPVSEQYGDVASALLYAFARPAVTLLDAIVSTLWGGGDGTARWRPSHAPHGGAASYVGLKFYLPDWLAERYPGMRRKIGRKACSGALAAHTHTHTHTHTRAHTHTHTHAHPRTQCSASLAIIHLCLAAPVPCLCEAQVDSSASTFTATTWTGRRLAFCCPGATSMASSRCVPPAL